jgi:hypothetical protein
MKTFPTAFATELAKKTGIYPIWILRITVDGTVYNLSDIRYTFPVGSLNGFAGTTLPWVSSWGGLRENVSGNIGEILIADIPITLLVDQDDADNIKHLALQHELEKSPSELYLWLDGLDPLTVAPQLMFRGYIKDIEIPDETQVHTNIEDESTRLQKYIGTKITSEAYPLCDPDVVGQVIPIVYGTVEKLPALCVDSGWVSTITVDLTAIAVTVAVSELPAYSLVNKSVVIDEEVMLVQSIFGKILTVTRTLSSAVAHTKGSLIVGKRAAADPLVYLCADHSVTSIDSIFARVNGLLVDITSDCNKYLGSGAFAIGGQLAAYPGKALVTIPDIVSIANKIYLSIDNQLFVTQGSHTHASSLSTTSIGFDYMETTGAFVSAAANATDGNTATYAMSNNSGATFKLQHNAAIVATGTPVSARVKFHMACSYATGSYKVIVAGAVVLQGNFPAQTKTDFFSQPFTITAFSQLLKANSFWVWVSISGSQYLYEVSLEVTTGSPIPASAAIGVGLIGSLGLSGNSISDILIGDALLVNCTRNITTPAAVVGNLLSTYCNDTTLTQIGSLPADYLFNGAITEYKKAIEWLDLLAFQCRCWYRKSSGVSRLIVRSAAPVSPTTISTCAITGEGIKDLSYRKAPITDVINTINVLYNRDWSSTQAKALAFKSSKNSTNAASILNYGPLEQPDMFMFDFVDNPTMAADLAGFYHDFYAVRKWLVTFRTYMDRAALEFADNVQLAFANDLTGVIIEAGIQPGTENQIDSIQFTVATTSVPVEVVNGLVTLLGDQLYTKNMEALIYA